MSRDVLLGLVRSLRQRVQPRVDAARAASSESASPQERQQGTGAAASSSQPETGPHEQRSPEPPAGLTARRIGRYGQLGGGGKRGVALVVVTVAVAVLAALFSDFAFNATVDLVNASQARDQLRAEYLARSSIQLGRLLIKVQQSVLDKNRQFVGDVQIADFAPYLIKAFGGASDERAGLGALLGIDTTQMKGLGAGKDSTFDLVMTAEDGRLNLNCGGGLTGQQQQPILYGMLQGLFFPPRYNSIFESADSSGQYYTRDDVARAIIDWADVDEQRFDPAGQGKSGGAEAYNYDAGRDPFRAHNHFFDTIEEVGLVRGVDDRVWGYFGELLTVYGGCKLNLNAIKSTDWPLLVAVLRATVKDDQKTNPVLLDDNLLGSLAQQVLSMGQLTGGFQSVQQFITLATNPAQAMTQFGSSSSSSSGSSSSSSGSSGASGSSSSVAGLPLDPVKVNSVLTVGPRRIWRLDATGTVSRAGKQQTDVRIRAVWDTMHYNQNTTSADPNDRMGTWVYWRVD